MIYLLFTAVAVLSALAVYIYCSFEGVFSPIYKKLPLKQQTEEATAPFSEGLSLIIATTVIPVLLLVQTVLYKNTQTVAFIKLYVLLVIVISAGIIDFKKKIIPNLLVCFGLLFWVGITVYDVVNASERKALFTSELLGFALGFGLLAVVSLITKGAIGFGDVKLFGIIGLIGGAFCTYSTLLVSLIVSVVVAMIGLITKKIGRKDSIPFGPCITVGYLIVLFLGSY